jgi:hypothetical protein
MNAYISVLMIGYAFLSFKFFRQRNEVMGDVMSLAVILYTGCAVYTVSSPNTDYFAMVLVGYIINGSGADLMSKEVCSVFLAFFVLRLNCQRQ